MTLVTPGIRPAGTAAGDQKRIMTPAARSKRARIIWSSDGPIVEAPDPKAAAEAIVSKSRDATLGETNG